MADHTIIVLGGGYSQVPVIKSAKDMGYRVIAIDRNPSAPGFSYADIPIIESTYEIKAVMESLAKYEHMTFKGIIARTTGPPLYTAIAIAGKYGLAGLTQELVEISTDKAALRKFCSSENIRFPDGSLADDNVHLSPPLIIKPNNSVLGKQMIRVFQDNSFSMYLPEIENLSLDRKVEVESFVTGIDSTCLCKIHNGNVSFITWFDELVGIKQGGCIQALGLSIPSVIFNTAASLEAEKIIQKIVRRFPSAIGLLLFSFRIDMCGMPYLIEIHADLGGDLIAEELLPAANSNFDFFKEAIMIAVNQPTSTEEISFLPTLLYYSEENKQNPIESFPNRKIIHGKDVYETLSLFEKCVRSYDPTIDIPLHKEWLEKNGFRT